MIPVKHWTHLQERSLTIEEASSILKIPKHTLRFWEKTFEGFLTPSRTKGGQRRFNAENIALVLEIRRMRERGMGLSEIREELNHRHRGDPSGSNHIDLLAQRVAEIVKAEVFDFFEGEREKT